MNSKRPWWILDPEVTRNLERAAVLIVMPGCLPLARNKAFGDSFRDVTMADVELLPAAEESAAEVESRLVGQKANLIAAGSKTNTFDEFLALARDNEGNLPSIRCICDRLQTLLALVEDDCPFERARQQVTNAQAAHRLDYVKGFQYLKRRDAGSIWPNLDAGLQEHADSYWYEILPFTTRAVDWESDQTLQTTMNPIDGALRVKVDVHNDGRSGRPGLLRMVPYIGARVAEGWPILDREVQNEPGPDGLALLNAADGELGRAFDATRKYDRCTVEARTKVVRELFTKVERMDKGHKLYPQLRSLVVDLACSLVSGWDEVRRKLFEFRIGLWDAPFIQDVWTQHFEDVIGSASTGKNSPLLTGLTVDQKKALVMAGQDQRKLDRSVASVRTMVTFAEPKDQYIMARVSGWEAGTLIPIPKSSIPHFIDAAPGQRAVARATLYVDHAEQVVLRHFEPLPLPADE